MTEAEIRRKALEGGLSVETADSMVRSSSVADDIRRGVEAIRRVRSEGRFEPVYGIDGTRAQRVVVLG